MPAPRLPFVPLAAADATGSMVVGMLSKKLERMAREARRQQRLQRHAARQRARSAAASSAADGAAAPPAGPAAGEAALGAPGAQLPAMAEGRPAVSAAPSAEPEQLGFGWALKRLLTDTQASLPGRSVGGMEVRSTASWRLASRMQLHAGMQEVITLRLEALADLTPSTLTQAHVI